MLKTILVTGASGLIGNAVITELAKKGHKFVALDLSPNPKKHSSVIKEIIGAVETLDLNEELNNLKIDFLIHCAAHPGGKSLAEPTLDVQVNAYGCMKIFEWAAHQKVEVLFLSSSAIYGNQVDHPIKEDDRLHPNTIYAVCKEAAENFLRILEEGYGLKWTVIRLFATYGAGHKPSKFQGVINILMTQMMEGKKVVVKGSLQRKRGLVEVEDAARAIALAVENPKARGQIINISHPKMETISDLIDVIAEALGKKRSDFDIQEEAGTVGDTFYNYANTDKAREILGFEATISLKEGVTKMLKKRIEQGV